MGERKVLNKYFPPDFDPAKLPRGKRVRTEDKQMKVRMMLPMSVRCDTCGNFMYKGTKFNTRMEDVRGEAYLGIKIFRFYFRCTSCSAEFCLKTDPKNADYVVEAGATRNYEPWRDKEKDKTLAVAEREEEERGNAMKALENRTLDSKREMDILNALDEMKSLRTRHAQVDTETALAALKRGAMSEQEILDAEDEEAVQQMLLQRAGVIRRLSDSEDDSEVGPRGTKQAKQARQQQGSGGLGPSVASHLWEEEEEEKEKDGAEERLQNGDISHHHDPDDADGNGTEAGGGSSSHAGLVSGVGSTIDLKANKSGGNASGFNGGNKKGSGTGFAEKPPPVLPKFGARPVAVVVKKKAEAPSSTTQQQQQQQQQKQEEEKAESSEEANGLLGLGDYGTESD